MKTKFFQFKPSFGWSELIAILALGVAITGFIITNPLREDISKRPRILVIESKAKELDHSKYKEAFYIGVKNIGKYPIVGLQYVFDLSYINIDNPSADEVELIFQPTYPYKIEIKHNLAYVRLNNALPPDAEVYINILGTPASVTILTDYGNTIYLDNRKPPPAPTGLGIRMYY